ncbi:MAG: citrate transporter [Lachnospiraceae bacterium]|nr:citrate transporter [Lachnospiraceae bacterium]
MLETAAVLTPLHFLYLAGVIVILGVMVMRKDTPAVCIGFLFLLGLTGRGNIIGGIQTVFNAMLYAGKEFMEIIATIALVSALSKALSDLGSDYLLMKPMSRIMKTPALTWWILGFTMLIFSLFLWPSPSVALVGAIMLPFAIQAGLTPLAAAMAMNLFGHGIALSYDVVVQGAPAISASAAGIPASQILTQGRPVFWVMGIATTVSAFLLNRRTMSFSLAGNAARKSREYQSASSFSPSGPLSRPAKILAVATPLAFFADIAAMLVFDLRGGDATSIVSGTAVLLMCLGAVLASPKDSLEKITGYLTDGFLFAIRIFAPVIAIGAFFFLGGEGISTIMGDSFSGGIMNDWAVWLASHAPLNKYFTAAIQMIVGALTGLDGSGFSGLPLTGALANTFGTAVGASVPVLAALGQITAIFVGGGTLVPWGLIPVAAICNVSPLELARKNFLPVLIGFACTFAVACLLL